MVWRANPLGLAPSCLEERPVGPILRPPDARRGLRSVGSGRVLTNVPPLAATTGDAAEALNWLTQIDKRYGLTDENMGIGDFIEEQIESILADIGEDDELVVVDDKSTDDTAAIVQAIVDSRLRVYRSPENRRYVRTFNAAAEMARGEYIFFADQDDVWVPGRTERLIEALGTRAVVAGNVALFGGPARRCPRSGGWSAPRRGQALVWSCGPPLGSGSTTPSAAGLPQPCRPPVVGLPGGGDVLGFRVLGPVEITVPRARLAA